MEFAPHRVSVSRSPVFEDGLGKRYEVVGPAGDLLEMLVLGDEFNAVPEFEAALEESAGRFASFHHPSYARIRGVQRLGQASTLCVVSERVPGTRLSDVLTAVEQHRLTLDVGAALLLVQQLVRAVAVLHDQMPGACHGAIAPERIIVTPGARLVVMDHVFGTALEQLRFSRERYWKDLRIPLPKAAGLPHFDQRADTMQAGAVALALLHGRLLRGREGPDSFRALADDPWRPTGDPVGAPPPAAIRTWLARALQLDAHQSFGSAGEAAVELGLVVDAGDHSAQLEGLRSFVTERARPATSERARQATPARSAMSGDAAPIKALAQEAVEEEPHVDENARIPPPHRGWIAASVALVALAGGGALLASQWSPTPPAPVDVTGTLIVNTNPPGAAVVLDGEPRGAAPLTLEVTAGMHVLEVRGDGEARRIPLAVTAGATMSQHIELPVARAETGRLHVQSEPQGARVTVDGALVGATPLTIEGLAPGTHTVRLADDLGSVTHDVLVEGGVTSSLVAPMRPPQGVPVSGWISVVAPVDVRVYENERLLGSSQSDRIMVSAGRHELDIVSEALGYRARQTVSVSPGQVTPVRLDWPMGSISINAHPWAEVWIDGKRAGDTPIGNMEVPIGPHEIAFRHPELGEHLVQTTVALTAPTRVSVDLSKR
jgi:hypothetical protein